LNKQVVIVRTNEYNFEVENYRIYYVSGAKVLVHNSGSCDNVPGKPKKFRNDHLANDKHPKTDVPFDKDGFPDFSEHLYKDGLNDVKIKPTGKRDLDELDANLKAHYEKTPEGYTWHHHQTSGRMQLVESNIHSKTGHTGG